MKFIIGEGWQNIFDRLTYRGIIGIAYKGTLTGLLAYLIFGIICILAIIGLLTVLKWLLFGKK